MPILPHEPDCLPEDLLEQPESFTTPWWLLHTRPRQEKTLTRLLRGVEIPHYAPVVEQRHRSPAGRMRTSYLPLFATYVFMRGTDEQRYEATCTGGVIKALPITQVEDFLKELKQIKDLIELGVPLTIESRIGEGQAVRVRSGVFKGYEGTVIRRENHTHLLVFVRFMESGVSVKLDDCQLEVLGESTKR